MKILTCTSPGFFEYGEATMPHPTANHAIIKIKNIGICGTDLHAFVSLVSSVLNRSHYETTTLTSGPFATITLQIVFPSV